MSMSKVTPRARLEARLVIQPNGCREWQGATTPKGYGVIGDGHGGTVRTHVLAWTLAKGPIPAGQKVLHHCDNPPCGETEPTEGYPDGHLFLGTHADNMADMVAKGRSGDVWATRTHCPSRHELTEANTYVTTQGRRTCRACGRAAMARYTQRKALA